MKKPSKRQLEVLTLMANGYELSWSRTFNVSISLQKGGIGHGGPTWGPVHASSACVLRSNNWIKCVKSDWPSDTYIITDAGKALVQNNG